MPVGDAMVRFDRATMAVRTWPGSPGLRAMMKRFLKESGYGDANDYWQVAMSQTMRVPTFVWLLQSHLGKHPECFYIRIARRMPHDRRQLVSRLLRLRLQEAWEVVRAMRYWFI